MRYNPRTLIGLAAGVALCASGQVIHGQSVERLMTVSVVDGDGVPVTGLTPADFIVREDDVEREVLSVRRDTEPKQIALLVDTSQAAAQAVGDFKRAAGAFVEAMHEGNEISIISFGGTPKILSDASSDPAELAEGVGRIFSYSSTASYLLDAASETATGFARRGSARPIIVVLSTVGVDFSNMNDQTLLDRLGDAGVAMHTVVLLSPTGSSVAGGQPVGAFTPSLFDRGFASSPFRDQDVDRDRFLTVGPPTTGGRRFDLLLSASAEQALVDIGAQIHGQYLLEYSRPAMLLPPDRVDVDVRQAGLDARATPIRTGNAPR